MMQNISAADFLEASWQIAAEQAADRQAAAAQQTTDRPAAAQQATDRQAAERRQFSRWLIDARTPAEHRAAHLAGSLNFFALSDAEHHRVGELYARDQWSAKALGAALICANASRHIPAIVRRSRPHASEIFITCARGGQRSGSLGHILGQIGFSVRRCEGGMKALRAEAMRRLQSFADGRFVALAGLTACGKTRLLQRLPDALDLEGLAHHLGSTFGSRGAAQPSQQQFDFSLLQRLYELRAARRIFIEAESKNIGKITLTNAFYEAMNSGVIVLCEASLDVRVSNCVADYEAISPEFFYACMQRLRRYLGGALAEQIARDYEAGRLADVARALLLEYYDRVYRQPERVDMRLNCDDLNAAARKLAREFGYI